MEVKNFLSMVGQISDAHQRARDLYLHRFAPDYNTFDFIEPDEMRLSKILAWLLNPHQTHGQRGLFLRLFLEAVGLKAHSENYDRASVLTEVTIKDGRLDIVVSAPNLWIVIENKPWAGDQDNQLERYFAHLDGIGTHDKKVVYLTPKGTAPAEHSIRNDEITRRIEEGHFCLWGYQKDVQRWLARCRAECQADRVSMFIDEFSRYIRMVFEGVKDRTMSDHLIDQIVGSAENVSAAIQVILLAESIRKRLLSDLRQQVRGAKGRATASGGVGSTRTQDRVRHIESGHG